MVDAKIGVKYCGGCNPQINRSKIVREIKANAPGFAGVIPADTPEPWAIGIMMCACPFACVDTPDVRKLARDWIVVSGSMVDRYPVEESEISERAVEKCKDLLDSAKE